MRLPSLEVLAALGGTPGGCKGLAGLDWGSGDEGELALQRDAVLGLEGVQGTIFRLTEGFRV